MRWSSRDSIVYNNKVPSGLADHFVAVAELNAARGLGSMWTLI